MRRSLVAVSIMILVLVSLFSLDRPVSDREARGAEPGVGATAPLDHFSAIFLGPGFPAEDGVCPALTVVIEGVGIGTHLGSFSTAQSHCVDPTGPDPLAFSNGHYTFTSVDESTIAGRYSGRLVPTETTTADDLYRIDGRFAIEAGTGRFAGATGGGLASGLQNLTTGEASVVLDGIITYPGMTPTGVDTTRFQQP